MPAPQIKPCPFCGGEGEYNPSLRGVGHGATAIRCRTCGVRGPNYKVVDAGSGQNTRVRNMNKREAITAWNTRSGAR